MHLTKRLPTALCAALALPLLLLSSPVQAERFVTSGVSFFERVTVGFVEVTPITVFYDDRCVDQRLCFRSDTMLISAVLHDAQGLTEVVLELGQPVQVPGGLLILTNAGTPASRQGAINIEKYQLELVFIPL